MNRKARIRDESGFVLITVLVILVALTAIVSVAQTNAGMEQRIDANSAINTQSYYAAEAGAEKLLAAVRGQMNAGLLTLTTLANIDTTPPTIQGYKFTEYGAALDAAFTSRAITQGPYAGLTSLDRDLVVSSSVSGPAGARSSVNLMARVQTIPIFQFGVFYEKDLEVTPGPLMNFRGRVHTNADLYVDGNAGLYFYEMVSAAGDLHMHHKSASVGDGQDNFVEMDDASFVEIIEDTHDFGGDDIPGTLPTAAQDAAFDAHSQSTWDNMIQTRASGIEPLDLPIPAGIDPYELIEPCTGAESAELQGLKYGCNADIVIRVLGDSLTIEDGAGNPMTKSSIYFLPNQFYDDREQSNVAADVGGGTCNPGVTATNSNSNRDVIDIKVDEFDASEYGAGVLYVTADSVGSSGMVPGCLRQYVVRLHNGKEIHAPLTVATNLPLYMLGDYNSEVDKWQPASLAADALTLLSDGWDDSKSGEGPTEDNPDNTTVNAAIVAGHTETPAPGAAGGGQFENFPRFLENWSGKTFTISGSFVSLWTARKAGSQWGCCQYYVPPNRNWGFDARFRDPNTLPPMTPVVGQILRVGFVRRY